MTGKGFVFIVLLFVMGQQAFSAPPADKLWQVENENYSRGDWAGTITAGNEILKKTSRNVSARYLVAGALVRLGKLEEALAQYKVCLGDAHTTELQQQVEAAITQTEKVRSGQIQRAIQVPLSNSVVMNPQAAHASSMSRNPSVQEAVQRLTDERDQKLKELDQRTKIDQQKVRDERDSQNGTLANNLRGDYNTLGKPYTRSISEDANKKLKAITLDYHSQYTSILDYYNKRIQYTRNSGQGYKSRTVSGIRRNQLVPQGSDGAVRNY